MPAVSEMTPMLRHYLELKAQYPDALLFYRMGDFYELFFDDAKQAAELLELTLTARQRGTDNEAPMCGVPHHAVEGYIARLIRLGLKVAVCDQMEDPAQAKGLVRREITRIVTPGTLSETALLESKEENQLAALVWEGDAGAGAFLDLSTGRFFLRRYASEEDAITDLEVQRPREALAAAGALPPALEGWLAREVACRTDAVPWLAPAGKALDALCRQFGTATLRGFGIEDGEPGVRAAGAALAYAQATQRSALGHVRTLALRSHDDRLAVDATTFANLEVFRPQREGERRPTLLSVLDSTRSAAGGRMLRDWLRRPLREADELGERHAAVALLVGDGARRSRIRSGLERVADLERLATRAVIGTLAPREAAALRETLALAPALLAEASVPGSRLLAEVARTESEGTLGTELHRLLAAEPASSVEDGGVIGTGVSAELDEARSLATDAKRHLLALEERERKRTGIASLKLRYNRVFGYSIEVTRANQAAVPNDYQRRQTLANAERYITPELKELEERILHAEERQLALERELFAGLRQAVAARASGLASLCRALATLDVLASFAETAAKRDYVRPELRPAGSGLRVEEGRHPVMETLLGDGFVPNDLALAPEEAQIVVLTGPNMGGKSTYLRQAALLVLMAQAGSFVPARRAEIGLVDRIFSRVGASDDLARGESTFMVEMIETSNILRFATAESLVILDEVGRGTATFDGLSLAWAIVEHLHEHARALTLFATHYHELTELADLLPRVVNRTLAVKEWEDRIVFLKRVIPGSADKSYGIHVARLAGLPESVLARAEQVLANLEAQEYDPEGRPRLARGELPAETRSAQMPLFTPAEEIVARLLRELEIERLTPLAALNVLASLKERLR